MSARSLWAALAVACALGAVLLWAGCGTGMKTAYGSLSSAEALVVAVSRELPAYSEAHQRRLVEAAGNDEEAARSAVKAWRERREHIVKAIEGGHASVQLARDAIHDIEKGVREKHEIQDWIAPALRAVLNLRNVLKAVGVHIPGII